MMTTFDFGMWQLVWLAKKEDKGSFPASGSEAD
jgi:hypothetical protein